VSTVGRRVGTTVGAKGGGGGGLVLGDLGSLSGGRGCQGPFYLLLKRFIAGVDRAFAAHVWSVLRKKGAVRQGGVAFFDLHAVVAPPPPLVLSGRAASLTPY